MISPLAAVVAGVTGIYVLLWALLHFTQDAQEPEAIDDTVPFLSPILGMASRGSRYHTHLRCADGEPRHACVEQRQVPYKLPIYTLRMPGARLYVTNDTSLIPVLQRQVRTLSISPILVRVFSHFMGVSKQALDIMGKDPLEDHGFVHSMTVETVKGLRPGPALDALNEEAVGLLNKAPGALADKDAPATVNMFQ